MVLARTDRHPEAHRLVGGVARAATQHNELCIGSLDRMTTDTHSLLVRCTVADPVMLSRAASDLCTESALRLTLDRAAWSPESTVAYAYARLPQPAPVSDAQLAGLAALWQRLCPAARGSELSRLALLFDAIGLGGPFWWLAGKSLELLLGLAHWTAGMPGAVTMMPTMGQGAFALFLLGGLWLALWQPRLRLLGLVPALVGLVLLTQVRAPDLLISGDGRHVGITGVAAGELLVLRESRSDYTRDNLTETAGMNGETRLIDDWPGARCNRDFCALALTRNGRTWQLLIGRGTDYVAERDLAAACERADIVIAGRYLPYSCKPRWLKADRRMLDATGGLTIDLAKAEVQTVAESQGQHGWWHPPADNPRPRNRPPAAAPSGSATPQ